MSQPFPPPVFDSYTYQSYQRQRQLTLGDLLLENRIVFLQGEIYVGRGAGTIYRRSANPWGFWFCTATFALLGTGGILGAGCLLFAKLPGI